MGSNQDKKIPETGQISCFLRRKIHNFNTLDWEGERQKDWSCPLLSKITKKNYYRCLQIAIPFSLLSSLSLFIFFEKENIFLVCLRSWDNGRTWYVIKKTDYARRMSVRRDLSFLFSLRLILINCLKSAN